MKPTGNRLVFQTSVSTLFVFILLALSSVARGQAGANDGSAKHDELCGGSSAGDLQGKLGTSVTVISNDSVTIQGCPPAQAWSEQIRAVGKTAWAACEKNKAANATFAQGAVTTASLNPNAIGSSAFNTTNTSSKQIYDQGTAEKGQCVANVKSARESLNAYKDTANRQISTLPLNSPERAACNKIVQQIKPHIETFESQLNELGAQCGADAAGGVAQSQSATSAGETSQTVSGNKPTSNGSSPTPGSGAGRTSGGGAGSAGGATPSSSSAAFGASPSTNSAARPSSGLNPWVVGGVAAVAGAGITYGIMRHNSGNSNNSSAAVPPPPSSTLPPVTPSLNPVLLNTVGSQPVIPAANPAPNNNAPLIVPAPGVVANPNSGGAGRPLTESLGYNPYAAERERELAREREAEADR